MLTEDEVLELVEGCLLIRDWELNPKEEKCFLDMLKLIRALKIRAKLQKIKRERMSVYE